MSSGYRLPWHECLIVCLLACLLVCLLAFAAEYTTSLCGRLATVIRQIAGTKQSTKKKRLSLLCLFLPCNVGGGGYCITPIPILALRLSTKVSEILKESSNCWHYLIIRYFHHKNNKASFEI